MIAEQIAQLKRGMDLNGKQMQAVMEQIMSGQAAMEEMIEFLVLLQEKGPTVDEIRSAASVMKKFCVPVESNADVVFDLVGTGGDHKNTFNISTISALVIASAGVIVAKHGNRSASSRCGTADVLEALGVNLSLSPEVLSVCLERVGFAFLFARDLHPAMKHVAAARKAIGKPTIFNILGPLTNPASPTHQLLGVYEHRWVEPFIHILKDFGLKRAMVVHGDDGMDEVTTTTTTQVAEWDGRDVRTYTINPMDYGIELAGLQDLMGGDLHENAAIAKDILNGAPGPKRDAVLLNAAVGFYTAQKVNTISDGIELAAERIDSGAARKKLDEVVHFTNTGARA